MTLKVYGDLYSQPTRAVVLLCLANNIHHELVLVDISKKEHTSPEFKAMNPACQIPVLDDDGFILPESTAILRYLAASRHLPDHWYPADVKARARVDHLLDWYHTNIRQTAGYVLLKELLAHLWKTPAPQDLIRSAEEKMTKSMDLVEEFFLKPDEGGPFLLGASQPSIGDVVIACEYTQTQFLPQAEQEALLSGRPKTRKWLQVMEKSLAPHFAAVHEKMPHLIQILETARRSTVTE